MVFNLIHLLSQSMNQQNVIMNNHHQQQSQASHPQVESQELVHTNVPYDHHHHHTLNAANSYGILQTFYTHLQFLMPCNAHNWQTFLLIGFVCLLSVAISIVSAIIPSNSMNNSAQNTGNGTCLHCNTMRRTTGVHQTTQTGPVSPIPQNINNKTVFLGFSDNGDFEKASTSSSSLRQVS